MTMDQSEKPTSSSPGTGDSVAPGDVSREGTKEEIRQTNPEKPKPTDTDDNLRDGTKS
jgi:hypothetical protein